MRFFIVRRHCTHCGAWFRRRRQLSHSLRCRAQRAYDGQG